MKNEIVRFSSSFLINVDFRFPKEKVVPFEERWDIVKGWFRSIFLEDWITKLIALFITLVIWYGVTGRRSTPTTIKMRGVHLNFRLPSDTEIANEPIDEVEITVTGDKTSIDRLNPRDLAVVVDLSNYKTGDLVVQLKPDTVNIDLPAGVKTEEIEPNKIALKLEPRIEKLIEVRPAFSGQLPDGYETYSTAVTPQRVRVRGAASQVEPIERVSTEKINLENLTGDTVVPQVTVDLLNPKVTVLDALVDVALKIGEQRVEKTFTNVPVREISGADASPQNAAVVLYGVASVINSLQSENMQILLETGADNQTTPRLSLPPEVEGRVEIRQIKPNVFSISR